MHPLVYNGVLFSSREVIVGGRKVPYAPLFLCFCVCVCTHVFTVIAFLRLLFTPTIGSILPFSD